MAHLRPRQWLIIVATGLVLSLIKPALSATPLVNRPTANTPPAGSASQRGVVVNDTASHVRLLSHIGGPIHDIYVTDNKAFISEGRSITILDVSQPASPKVLGRINPLAEAVKGLVAQNNYVYVVAGSAGLHIFDVSNPANALRIGFYDTPGEAVGLVLVGNYAYIADGNEGMRIIDVTNPATLREVGFYKATGNTEVVYAADGYVYLIADGNLWIVSVTDPVNPVKLSFYETPGSAYDLHVVGSYAYIADGNGGLRVIDVRDRTKPVEAGAGEGWIFKIYVSNNFAYTLDYDGGMAVVDVTNPTRPTEAGFYGIDWNEDVYVVGRYAYVVNGSYLKIVDILNPSTPTEVGSYSTPQGAEDVYVLGSYAYVTDGFSGLHVVDVTKPTAAKTVGFYEPSGAAVRIFVAGNYAYMGNYDNGLSIVDITNPTAPTEAGFYQGGPSLQRVFVAGQYAYLPDGAPRLNIVDVTNPAALHEVGYYETPHRTEAVYVSGNYAYVADGESGLRVLNVTNPAKPTEVGFVDTPGFASGIYVSGNYAYVADGLSGLRIVHIGNPAAPSAIGFLDTPGAAGDVYVSGSYAYVADGSGGLRVINVANPAAPAESGSYVTPEYAQSVFVAGNIAYLASRDGGLSILRYPDCYRMTLTYSGAGGLPTVTPNNSSGCAPNEYVPQAFVTLSASPAPGWRVASWTGTSNDSSVSLNNTVTMPAADHAVSVNYAPICYILTLTHSGAGSNPMGTPANSPGCAAGEYVAGAPISLQAAPGVGQTVGSWIGTAADGSAAMNNTLTMPANNHTAGVTYVLACYTLTLTHSGSGNDPLAVPTQSSGCPVNQYHYQEPINLSATPATGWQISSWSGTVNNAATTATNSFAMLPNDHTVSVNYSEIPTAGPGDIYEVDGACTRSRSIATDGSEVQEHTFHAVADADWVRFTTAAAKSYRIEVQTPADSPADVNLEVYAQCEAPAFDSWNKSFSPGARLDVTAPASGQVYVRLANEDANQAGDNVRYTISVRALNADTGNRALILVAGRLKGADSLQKNIHNVTNAVYKLFQRNGYTDNDIWYLATDSSLPGYDAALNKESLHTAITAWAKDKVGSDGVLTLYLMDHGSPETFYLDELSGQRLSPHDLNSWLNELESAAPQVKINVFIEACQSGSFITNPGSISKAGRVVITSSNAESDARASKDGAYFSDHLLTWLHQDYNLSVAFAEARSVVRAIFSLQQAMLDADGNGVPNEFTDSNAAAKRSFAYAGTLAPDWSPHIFAVQPPAAITNFRGTIEADVRDDVQVRQVWAVVYPPDYVPPPAGQELQPEVLPTFLLTALDNGNRYAGEFTGFTQSGTYRIIVHAEDQDGLVARPVVLEVNTGSQLYLPLIVR